MELRVEQPAGPTVAFSEWDAYCLNRTSSTFNGFALLLVRPYAVPQFAYYSTLHMILHLVRTIIPPRARGALPFFFFESLFLVVPAVTAASVAASLMPSDKPLNTIDLPKLVYVSPYNLYYTARISTVSMSRLSSSCRDAAEHSTITILYRDYCLYTGNDAIDLANNTSLLFGSDESTLKQGLLFQSPNLDPYLAALRYLYKENAV